MEASCRLAASKFETAGVVPQLTLELGVATIVTVLPDPPADGGGAAGAVYTALA
jgi:hypothetical protein